SDGRSTNWNEIAKLIPGRSNKDCRKRFYNGVTGDRKKGPWSEDEDARLEGLVEHYGMSWALIAQEMETRTADQCSKRWQHCLDPKLDHSSWTEQEVCCTFHFHQHLFSFHQQPCSHELNLKWAPLTCVHVIRTGVCYLLSKDTAPAGKRSKPNISLTGLPIMSKISEFAFEVDTCAPIILPRNQEAYPCPVSRFTILERRSLKSTHGSATTPEDSDNNTTSILDLDMVDQDLADFPDMQSNQIGSFLDETTQHHDPGTSTLLRRPSQLSTDKSIRSSCPLARLGAQVPSLTHSSSATSSNNSSCPGTAPFPPKASPDITSLTQTPTSIYNADSGFPFPSTTDASAICHTLTQTPPQTTSACPSRPDSAPGRVMDLPQGLEWPSPHSAGLSVGPETPGKSGARTTIVLEDAEPETILNVMKVIVGSSAKVKFETS
ncbi:MAG: hypothetical protein Q9225_003592, partial [Loekoesia sp. 1 TL-2023]